MTTTIDKETQIQNLMTALTALAKRPAQYDYMFDYNYVNTNLLAFCVMHGDTCVERCDTRIEAIKRVTQLNLRSRAEFLLNAIDPS
jgi:hypothetical protein